MKNLLYCTILVVVIGVVSARAGALFYVPIAASQSDQDSGISSDNAYTTAVDGGNASGTDRVVNGITLYALAGEGTNISADNCSLTVMQGSIANGGGSTDEVKADGNLAPALSDMIFNNEASDGSEQDIVLDPESLTQGTTYDLRIYISPAAGQDREVNLKFAGDGQASAETGWFNEDDATTSPGGFQDAGQVYYIDYRFTWDGDTTPGITVTQRSGRTPFCLYALTNQVVPEEENAAGNTEAAPAPAEATGEETGQASTEGQAESPTGGLSTGYVSPSSDEVGVSSDTFYSDDSLNSNGEWVDVGGYGKCWRPTKVSSDWCPYTNGRWAQCDECGWTWTSNEPWGWCTYHYGRWCHTVDTGWCWTPGTVWAPAWVSWRTGSGSDCSCVGWAPLPPEAGCQVGVGVGGWVDYTCGLGPGAYTFVNVGDFGRDNIGQCGCVIDRGRYVNIFQQTTNVTNISYVNIGQGKGKYVNIYNGGPDPKWVNTEIVKHGGTQVPHVYVNRVDRPQIAGGKREQLQGNRLSLAAPAIKPTANPQHAPKVAATIPKNKVDKGWSAVKDPQVKSALQSKIAQEHKGQTPKNAPAKLPPDVASRIAQKASAQPSAGAGSKATAQLRNLPKGAVVQQAGATRGATGARPGTKLGRPGERTAQGRAASQTPARAGSTAGGPNPAKGLAAPPRAQGTQGGKPGQRVGQKATAGTRPGTSPQAGTTQRTAGGIRPGQSLKKAGRAPTTASRAQTSETPAVKSGIQGKGSRQGQTQPAKAGVATTAQSRTGGASPTRQSQSQQKQAKTQAGQPHAKPTPTKRQAAEQQGRAQQTEQAGQQERAQQQKAEQQHQAAQEKQAQQQHQREQAAAQQKRGQQAADQRRQQQQAAAQQKREQQAAAQRRQEQQQAAAEQRQRQQQQVAQQQQQQQAAEQRRGQQQAVQQQQQRQQQQAAPRRRPSPTPTPH